MRPGTFRRYLHCHRSGPFKSISTGQRQLKSKGSCKISKHCFGMLEVTEEKDRVLVAFQKQHYGHTAELGHQRLSKTLSQGIAGQLEIGVPKSNYSAATAVGCRCFQWRTVAGQHFVKKGHLTHS
ncbi:uncharacterized protein LOC144152288 isoform X1 [Haemaphysalis longicornis]